MQPVKPLQVHPSDANSSERYIPALTGLRAVAAYLVFLHHYNPAPPGTYFYKVVNQGYVGVSIFFVLSGFLIYHRYAEAYFVRADWSWRIYLQNRFARIYPLYILLLLFTVGSRAWSGHPMDGITFLLNGTLLKGLVDSYKFSGIAQSWSLTVEITFYILAPLLFGLLKRWGALWLTVGLFSTGLLGWAYGFFTPLPFVLFYTFFGRSFEFIVGMWLARRWHQHRLPSFSHALLAGLLIGMVCLFSQVQVALFTTQPATLVWTEVILYNFGLPIGIGLVCLGLLTQTSVARQLLSHPFLQTLGRSSYAFYLIHSGVVANGLQKAGITHTGLLFCLLIMLAHVFYSFIEKALQQYFRTD